MSGFTTCAPLPAAAPDPSRRVNFTHGLVLGPRELTQESAYLANRVEELAREALGCGTVIGLAITVEPLASGPGLVVSPGLALSPGGRPIRLAMPHAVALDEWLDARRLELVHQLRPGPESPPGDLLRLFVVLGYRQCPTENEPAPGGPCRGDEASSMYTRLADDFCLELRAQAPNQYEDDLVRELASWLRRIEIVDDGSGTAACEDVLRSLRASALPSSPPYASLTSPPEGLRIDAADAPRCIRAAWLAWITEIRPLWRTGASRPSGCAADARDEVLLAEIELPVVVHHDGRWTVADASRIVVDQDRRPFLVPARLLQELSTPARSGYAAASPASAAGIVRGDTSDAAHRLPRANGLRVTAVADGEVTVSFDGYAAPAAHDAHQYIVKAMAQPRAAAGGLPVVVNVDGYLPGGIRLRVSDVNAVAVPAIELAAMEISIEISRIRG